MKSLSFVVLGAPVAQPRVKAQGVLSKSGRVYAHVYEPGRKDSPARQWKSDVKQAALLADGLGNLWEGPIALAVDFFLPRPANRCRKKDPAESIPCLTKPDLDNLIKAVKDALSGVIYRDDKQIWQETVRKRYHEIGGRPRAEIYLEELA